MTGEQTQLLMAAVMAVLKSLGQQSYSGRINTLTDAVMTDWRGSYSAADVESAMVIFKKLGMASISESPSGYISFDARQARANVSAVTSNAHVHPRKVIPLVCDYVQFGEDWLREMWGRYFTQVDARQAAGTYNAQAVRIGNIPAADRIVTLSDNQSAADELRSALSDLNTKLAEANDVGNFSDDEAEEARLEVQLLELAFAQERVRVDWIQPVAMSTLRWVAEKAAGAAVGKAALAVIAALAALFAES